MCPHDGHSAYLFFLARPFFLADQHLHLRLLLKPLGNLLNHMLNPAHIRGIEFVDLQNAQLLFHFSSSAHALLIA